MKCGGMVQKSLTVNLVSCKSAGVTQEEEGGAHFTEIDANHKNLFYSSTRGNN